MKQRIKLNERQLRRVVAESVKRVLKEETPDDYSDYNNRWIIDKFNFILNNEDITTNDLFEEIINILGYNETDKLADKLLVNLGLHDEYHEDDEWYNQTSERYGPQNHFSKF